MTDRIVRIREQGQIITRGLQRIGNRPALFIDDEEKLSVTFNWADWLGTDTITSVSNTATGASLSSESNTTTIATMTIEADYAGYIEHRITTAGGNVKEQKLHVFVNGDGNTRDDYGLAWRVW